MARKILERQSMPRSMVALSSYKQKDLLVEFDGLVLKRHRMILDSDVPQYSIVLSLNSAYGKAVTRDLHERFHSFDLRRGKCYLRTGQPSYSIPGLEDEMRALEKECPKCVRQKALSSFAPEGPLKYHSKHPIPLMKRVALDLTGPLAVCSLGKGDRRKTKIWLCIARDLPTGYLEVGPIAGYGAADTAKFIDTLACSFTPPELVVMDSGTHFTGLMSKSEGAQIKELKAATEDKNHMEIALQVKQMKVHASRRGYQLLYAAPKNHKILGGCESAVKLIKRFFSGLPKEKWHLLDIILL